MFVVLPFPDRLFANKNIFNVTRTNNHLVHKQTLNHLAKVAK